MLETCVNLGIMPCTFYRMMPKSDFKRFLGAYGNDMLVVTFTSVQLEDPEILQDILNFRFKYIEITRTWEDMHQKSKLFYNILCKIKANGTKIIFKMGTVYPDLADALVIKGSEAAARSAGGTLHEEFAKAMSLDIPLIASGGIYTGEQVKHYLDSGAIAVSIGTPFACTVESPISEEAKQKIIASSSKDLQRFSNNNQQALIFTDTADTNENHQNSLHMGLDTGSKGHIFLGTAVDNITGIQPMENIVSELTKYIRNG
jgi:hypothetical protein